MRLKHPFLYLVLASGLLALLLLALNTGSKKKVLPASVLSSDRVALIDIAGVITSSHITSKGTSSARSIIEQLKKHGEDDSVRAIVLRIDSPGGTVVAAQEVYAAIQRLRQREKKVVVVSMADISASGGYYIACAADRVFANPGTITGSIGVIMEFPNVEGLFGKIGVETTTIKSGEFKDTGSVFRPMQDREKKVLQELVDNVFGQFVETVQENRGMSREEVTALADGRIFSGEQARELGLVDEVGDLESAIDAAALLAGIEGEPTIIREKKKFSLWDIIDSRLQSLLPLPAGEGFPGSTRLLYLWK